MKIEVNYNELYNLGNYMENMFEELKKDFEEIDAISESLKSVLQGSAEQAISTRIKNFNSTQFSQVVNYTGLLGVEVKNCAKLYNAEDDEFALKMKKEAAKYGVDSGNIDSSSPYLQATSLNLESAVPKQSTTISAGSADSTSQFVESSINASNNVGSNNIENTTMNVSEANNSQSNDFDDILIEEVESNTTNPQNIASGTSTETIYNNGRYNKDKLIEYMIETAVAYKEKMVFTADNEG